MKFFKVISIVSTAATIICSCKKPTEGYLSKVIVYNPKTLVATKGRVTTSAALLVDGSSNPINVKLLGVRNFYTKQSADSLLLKKYEILTYTGEITQFDTTLELMNKKLSTGMYSAFNINSLGGRIEVSPASNFIDTGTYEFDIEVTNPAGSRVVNNVGVIRMVPATNPYEITRQVVATTPFNAETPVTAQTNFTLTISRTAGPNRIILKFVDKNNKAFSPAAGQLVARTDFPVFRNFDPYYPEVKTDTTFIYQYPDKVPTFPLFQYTSINSTTGAPINRQYFFYYRIPAATNDLNANINPEIGFRLWPAPGEQSVSGTFVVTLKMNFVARKP